jgi:hypothetical protein
MGITVVLAASMIAQWLYYPSPGVPRTAEGKANLSAPAPRTPDGKPDFSGLWSPGYSPQVGVGKVWGTTGGGQLKSVFVDIAWALKEVPYQPWAAELAAQRKVREGIDGPETLCQPLFVLQRLTFPGGPKKIIQTPGLLVMLWERNMEFRQIFTDARPLPVDPNPSWQGYSSGKWEGDTLVVQTAGFRDGLWADGFGSPLTDAAKVTERIRRPNYGRMEVEVTVDDPKAYTRPWTVTLMSNIILDTELLEQYLCENEKDVAHMIVK